MRGRTRARRTVASGVLLLGLLAWASNVASAQAATKAVEGEFSGSPVTAAATVRAPHASSATLELNVDLTVRNDAQLKAKIASASTPASPGYGHYLTKTEYMASYAPTDAQVAAVESWLSGEGLQVTGASSDNLIVHVTGSTAAVERAFGVSINDYTAADGSSFYAPSGSPSVRADLAIESVSGLSDAVKGVTANVCSGGECGATGNELRTTYDITGNAEGETIGYVLWGQPLSKETYKAYAEKTGTPELKLGVGNEEIEFKEVGGANKETGQAAANAQGEETLDTEAAHVVAPKAHHVYFLANENSFTKLETDEQEAVESPAKVISNSWEVEPLACSVTASGMEKILEKAVSLGKSVFVSTGDSGATHGCAYPSSSAYAVAIGGTRAEIGPHGEYIKETALKDGGNCNNGVGRPSWQTGLGTVFVYESGACSGRVTPDVSAISAYSADETFPQGEPFLLVQWYLGTTYVFKSGGTSLAAPLWAAGVADLNHENALEGRPGIGFVDPTLYGLGPNEYKFDIHDVTEGTNGFAARAGYDEATGLGTPNFHELNHNPTFLTYTGATEAPSYTPATLSATLDGEGSKALEHRKVHFTVGAESCEGETNSSGSASCGVTIRDEPGSYSVVAKFAGDGAYLPKSTSAPFTVKEALPPLFGRCLKVAKGFYKNSVCTEKLGTETGTYEWSPGPGPKTGFSLVLKPTTTFKIETVGKHVLICTGATGGGAITGEKTMTLALTLTGCEEGGVKCTSTGIEGEIKLGGLTGTLGWLNKALKKIDLVLVGSEFVFGFYECPGKAVLLGSTGILMSMPVDKSSNKATGKFSEVNGKQSPNHLEGEEPRLFEEDRITEEKIETAGPAGSLILTFLEKYEVTAVA